MKAGPIRPVRPMMAVPASELPAGRAWSYEVKWDGYRTLAIKDGGRVELWSRNLKRATDQYPGIAAAVGRLRADALLLDGEVVALDETGRPSFQALHYRATGGLRLVYYAFDLLHVNGDDLTRRPLDERRAALKRVRVAQPILLSEPLPGTPQQIADEVRALQLEGVVAKRRDSTYQPGKRSPAWVKVRFVARQEFVVGGYKPSGKNFDSILVGYYERGRLLFAGKVRAGFTPPVRAKLFDVLAPLAIAQCPFATLPTGRTSHWGEGVTAEEMIALRWVRPAIVVEVAFTEWTQQQGLRHAAFAAVRSDKSAREVGREQGTGNRE
jgi:bifunctional non-homologous end joining protein LigD